MSEINQYQTPQSQVEKTGSQQFGDVKIFSVSGRIGRLRFLAYTLGVYFLVAIPANVIGGILAAIFGDSGMFVSIAFSGVASIVMLVFYFMFAIQRSHDMNVSGWLSLIILIPLIGYLIFLFAPGTHGDNRFGPPPPENSGGVVAMSVIGGLMMFVAVIGILAAIAIPAYQAYVEKAQQQNEQQLEQQR